MQDEPEEGTVSSIGDAPFASATPRPISKSTRKAGNNAATGVINSAGDLVGSAECSPVPAPRTYAGYSETRRCHAQRYRGGAADAARRASALRALPAGGVGRVEVNPSAAPQPSPARAVKKRAVEMMPCGKPVGASHKAWKSLPDPHIPTVPVAAIYTLKTYSRKEPSSPPAPSPCRLILPLEKTVGLRLASLAQNDNSVFVSAPRHGTTLTAQSSPAARREGRPS